MYWKTEAINKLKMYEAKKIALHNIPCQIKALESEFTAVKSSARDSAPVSGGTNQREDKLLSNIIERDELAQNYRIVSAQIAAIEKGLSILTDEELHILRRFYVDRHMGHIEKLCEELNLEQSQIYRKKDTALRKFVTAMYGVQDI